MILIKLILSYQLLSLGKIAIAIVALSIRFYIDHVSANANLGSYASV